MAGKKEQQMKEITERLEQGVKELFTSEMYTKYLRTMSQFHNYSFNNTVLIAMQKPESTLVAGYQTWQKKFKRQVKRGEKGIQIIAPAPVRRKEVVEKVDPATNELVIGKDGQPETEEIVTVIPRFRVTTVFDITQTYGEPLPELETPELTGNVENYEIFMQAVREVSPVPIRFDKIEGDARGFYSNTDKEIVIREGMSEAQTMKTAVHEVTHAKLHDRDVMKELGEKKDRMTGEVEAESVAYTVCQYFGLDTSDYSFPYIAGWSSSQNMRELRASMDTIRRTAGEFIDSMAEVMQRLLQEQPEKGAAVREGLDENFCLSGEEDCYAIYQIADGTKGQDYRFMSMDYVTSHHMAVDASDYRFVYGGRLSEQDTLDSLYEKFNMDHPADFTGHSLSMSDVVVMNRGGEAKAYYVDRFGFADLPGFIPRRLHETERNRGRGDSKITMETSGVEIEQHEGLWHAVDQIEIQMRKFYLMKHNEYGDSVAAVIVDENGELVAQELENGFDQGALEAVREYFVDRGTAWEPDAQEKRAEGKTRPPVYRESLAYAVEHAAADEYLDSRKLNIDCRKAVEAAVRDNFDGMHLADNAVDSVLEEYGSERLAFVLACTVQHKSWDGRFSEDTKEWAEGIPVPEAAERGRDMNLDYVVESHPAVLDGFIRMAREKFKEPEQGSVERKEKNKKTLTAEAVSDLKGRSHTFHKGSREAVYEFDCLIEGKPAVLTYTTEKREYFYSPLNDRGEEEDVFSIHSSGDDIWNRMPESELSRLERTLAGEAETFLIEERIHAAESISDLKDVDYSMMDMENTAMMPEQKKRIWEEMDRKGTLILEEAVRAAGTREELQSVQEDLTEAGGILREDSYEKLLKAAGEKETELAAVREAEVPAGPEPKITFYVAECMEFPVLGEYHNNLTLQEAVDLYHKIPEERMNGVKGIGFCLQDGSIYEGEMELMSGGEICKEIINDIPHYKESPLVQKAIADLEAVMERENAGKSPAEPEKKEQEPPEKEESRETSRPVRAESPEQKKTPENAPEKTQGSDRRQSVLQALRERKAKLKPRENQEPERKTQTHKKGEQALG